MKKFTPLLLALICFCLSPGPGPKALAETVTYDASSLQPIIYETNYEPLMADPEAQAEKFSKLTDVPYGSWFYDAVWDVFQLDLFSGSSETEFSPYEPMTRGMFVTVLGKLAAIDPAEYPGGSFSDVSAEAYYAPYVKWAAGKDFVAGTAPGRFSPEDPVTREQACILLYRYAVAEDLNLETIDEPAAFTDLGGCSESSKQAIQALYRATILSGRSETSFAPAAPINRAEGAQIFTLAHYILKDIKETVPYEAIVPPHLYLTAPAEWHGRMNLSGGGLGFATSGGGSSIVYCRTTFSYGRPTAMHHVDHLLFEVVCTRHNLRYAGRYFDEDGNPYPGYTPLELVEVNGDEWLILLHIQDPEIDFCPTPPKTPGEIKFAQLAQKKIWEVVDSRYYDPSVKVLQNLQGTDWKLDMEDDSSIWH